MKTKTENNSEMLKGGYVLKVKRRHVLWAIIAVLLISVLFLMSKGTGTGAAVATGAAVKSAAAPVMVGGC